MLDFSSRVGNIHNSYRANQDWEREIFIESLSFIGSAVGGSLVASAGTTALTGALSLVVAATPLGWAMLIIGDATVIGASAGASILANQYGKEFSDWAYDKIMELQTSK